MPRLKIRRNRPSFSQMSSSLPSPVDPLAFIQTARSGGSGGARDAYNQILGSFHDVLSDVERALTSIFERLRPDGNISDRMAMEANSDVRTELARANTIADVKRNEMTEGISHRLQGMFLQNLIMSPDQEPPVRRWASMADRVVQRDMPVVSEPTHSELDVSPNERRKRLARWQMETDEWLEVLCLNRVGEVIAHLLEEIGDYSASWTDTVNQLRRESIGGGRLFREVTDPEYWTFDNDDPTVKNLVSGVQAQEIAARILNRFQLSNMELMEVCQQVHQSLGGKPVYGSDRVDILELENLLAEATAVKIKDTVSIDDGFLSLISAGTRSGEELGELLVEMRMGAAAMEEKMWRVGEFRLGHVDSASGVGITSQALHDSVMRGLGGGRRFAAVEGHPSNNHRFEVQMATVGASLSDLAIFRDMVNAWYSWHFEERRGENGNRNARMEAVRKESWKLYPDIGQNSGVRPSVIELIDDDLRQVWNTSGDVALRLAYGHLEESDEELVHTPENGRARLSS